MASFEHGGSTIYYEEHGSGEPILLLPGVTERFEDISSVGDALAAKYRVIAADLPGSGRSLPIPRDYPKTYYEDDAKSFLALLEKLDLRGVRVVGFSDGGEVALLLAIYGPDRIRGVATWGAGGHIELEDDLLDAFQNVIDNPSESMKDFSDHLRARYGEAIARVSMSNFVRAVREIVADGGNISRAQAGSIQCPVLLITGEHDFIAPPSLVSQTVAEISAAEFVLVPGAGHEVQNTHSDFLVSTLIDWLSKH